MGLKFFSCAEESDNIFIEKFRVWVPKKLVKYYQKRYISRKEKYHDLEKKLNSARLPVTVPKYLAISLFYPLMLTPVFGIVSYLLSARIAQIYVTRTGRILPEGVKIEIQELPFELLSYSPDAFLIEIITFIVIMLVLFMLSRYLILYYPSLVVSQRKSKIDATLPHVVNVMLGMSKGGTPLLEIFKTIAEERGITGDVGKEFSIILRDVLVFHKDLITAIRYVSNTTPSAKFSEFLEDLVSVIEGGGKLSEFLEYKSSHFMEEREKFQSLFIETMEIMAEVYVAIFVVAPLFSLIVFVVMGMMGEDIYMISNAIVYLYIPVGGISFIWLIKSMIGETVSAWITERAIPVFVQARVVKNERQAMFKYKKGLIRAYKEFIRTLKSKLNLRLILKSPEYTLFITVPVAILLTYLTFNKIRIETVLVIDFVVIGFPFALVYEYRARTLKKFEEHLPDFLKQLGSLNESGLTLVSAIKVISSSNLGVLTKEVTNLRKDIEWGKLITEAFQRFEERIGSDIVSKVVSILVKALESTSNVKSAIFTAAADAEMYIEFRKRLYNEMTVYVIIIYITFAVFLFTVVILNQNFIKVFGNVTVPGAFVGATFVIPDVEKLAMLFYHATLLNAFFSGLVAGVMGLGNVKSGIKHSLVMVVSSLIVFAYLIGLGL